MTRSVTLIAPVAPFRGGIARHSEAVARALAAREDLALQVESFARLYPRWLYPGDSDRDPTHSRTPPFPVRYAIDSLAPWTWNSRASARTAAHLTVMPAWTFFVAPMLGTIARRVRSEDGKVVMVVHNAADHEAAGWKSRALNWQLAAADAFVTHTEDLARQLRAAGHGQPIAVVAHPPYADYPEASGTLPRERGLELLCFGLVREYKGVDIALRALAACGRDDIRLTIAGEIWEGEKTLRELVARPELRGAVELVDRYVTDAEAAELFARCDAVLAPYRSVTGSGVLALAQRYRRPVIASDLPGLSEAITQGRTGWLFPQGDDTALAELLRTDVTRQSAQAMQGDLAGTRDDSAWHAYASAILDLADGTELPRETQA